MLAIRLALLFNLLVISYTANCQPRQAISLSGGVASFANSHDTALLNYYKPRRHGIDLSAIYQVERDGRLGWDTGLSIRHVNYFTLSAFPASPGQQADTARISSRYKFILIPVNLRYDKRLNKIQLAVVAGLYAGWKTFGSETMVSQTGEVFIDLSAKARSRFPTFDSFGVQASIELNYMITDKLSIGLSGLIIQDASEIIYKENSWPHTFSGYSGRIARFQLKHYLK